MSDLRIGTRGVSELDFKFERVEEVFRIVLINADESGSMASRIGSNGDVVQKVGDLIQNRADLVVVNGFDSTSMYSIFGTPNAEAKLGSLRSLAEGNRVNVVQTQPTPKDVFRAALDDLRRHGARNSTSPKGHDLFLQKLSAALYKVSGDVELVVINTSDGGLDGGPSSPLATSILSEMRKVTSRCRCLLAVNLLVGSYGSPSVLSFFSGDTEKYENRLLLHTESTTEAGVIKLSDLNPSTLSLSRAEDGSYTVDAPLSIWEVTDSTLTTWAPEGSSLPKTLNVFKYEAIDEARSSVYRASVDLDVRDVTLERDGQQVFALIAKSHSDNPYTREASRGALNTLIAPLERLLTTRSAVLAMLTAKDSEKERLLSLKADLQENTEQVEAVKNGDDDPHTMSRKITLLMNVRRIIKEMIRTESEALDQLMLERELGFYEDHPNHWVVWLQPSIDELKSQLTLTQVDVGASIAHLSTKISTSKSKVDGVERSADRYRDKLLAQSRARKDYLLRKADPRDAVPFETPAVWTNATCSISGRSLTTGLAAIPFVADRSDLTSGNLMAGGQCVDRLPVGRGEVLSMDSVRSLMWGDLGQMASPYLTGKGEYNAAIPVLIGPASKNDLIQLESALGWLCTGTSAFGPQMAEALPGALASMLGAPSYEPDTSMEVHAILRTLPLLSRFRSYPYVSKTVVLDEAAQKRSLTDVWALSVRDADDSACLQNMGCITSYFARAVASDTVDKVRVALNLFDWGLRNVARSIFTSNGEGLSGLEGIATLASLLSVKVDLKDYDGSSVQQASVAQPSESGTRITRADVDYVLGDEILALWSAVGAPPIDLDQPFVDQVNVLLSRLSPDESRKVLHNIKDIFARYDEVMDFERTLDACGDLDDDDDDDFTGDDDDFTGDDVATFVQKSAAPPSAVHRHFDIASLDALKPIRYRTSTPKIASALARLRRIRKDGEVRWMPPSESGCTINGSVLQWLEGHTAFYPLRAWLRLMDAGLVGQHALSHHRSSETSLTPIPSCTDVMSKIATILSGFDPLVERIRMVFAFVYKNAYSYSDATWATANKAKLPALADEVFGPVTPRVKSPVHYKESDVLPRPVGPTWPKLTHDGLLLKGSWLDADGNVIVQASVPNSVKNQSDELVCRDALNNLFERAIKNKDTFVFGLHRQARAALGGHPDDLNRLDPEARLQVLADTLVPVMVAKVHVKQMSQTTFNDCLCALIQLCELGGDTRRFRAEEDKTFISKEASRIRQQC